MKKNYIFLVISMMIMIGCLKACPFTMVNDSKQPILVFDVQHKQIARIEPGKSVYIDPTLRGWRKYVRQETLDIYLEKKGHKNSFERRYRFTEKYCPVDTKHNSISLSDIERFAKKPTDRSRVQVFTSGK